LVASLGSQGPRCANGSPGGAVETVVMLTAGAIVGLLVMTLRRFLPSMCISSASILAMDASRSTRETCIGCESHSTSSIRGSSRVLRRACGEFAAGAFISTVVQRTASMFQPTGVAGRASFLNTVPARSMNARLCLSAGSSASSIAGPSNCCGGSSSRTVAGSRTPADATGPARDTPS